MQEKLEEYGQDEFLASENTSGIGEQEIEAIEMMANLSKYGFEKLMKDNNLDAMVTIGSGACTVLAIGGYPAITVPAGYQSNGMPFGISFGGLRGSEPKLIEISYAFEQATRERRPPSFLGREMSSAHHLMQGNHELRSGFPLFLGSVCNRHSSFFGKLL